MQINKDTWHYRAYHWTYKIQNSEWKMSDHSNLCSYVQRIFWMVPFTALFVVITSLMYMMASPFVFLFGARPTNIWAENNERAWAPYPGLKVWGEVRVHPWVVAVPAALIYLEWAWWHYCNWKYPFFTHLTVLLVIIGLVLYGTYDSSDARPIINAWFHAKKQGVCPVVDFVEEESADKSVE